MKFRVRPASTAFAALGLVILLALGTWQASRYQEKLVLEELQAARAKEPALTVVDSATLIAPQNAYRTVDVHGRMDTDRTVIFKFRTRNGKAGVWLASPLFLPDNTAVLTVRGWADVKEGPELARTQKLPDSGIYRGLAYTLSRNIQDDLTRASLPADPVESFVAWNTFDVEGVYAFWKLPSADTRTVLVLTQGDEGPPIESADYVTQPYMTADKHFGYALTWYLLAFGLVGLWLASGFGLIGGRRAAPSGPQTPS